MMLVAAHPLPVKRREHQFAARQKFVAARLNVDPGPNASPRCPAPVGRSIRSLLALNTSLTKIGSLITTAWPKSAKLTVNARPYCLPRAANIPCVAAKNARPCTVFGIRGPGGSRNYLGCLPCHVFPAFPSSSCRYQKVSDVAPSGRRLAAATRPTSAGRRAANLQPLSAEPCVDSLSDRSPTPFEHHVVAHIGEDFCFGTVCACRYVYFSR